jgi:hypothetical protein
MPTPQWTVTLTLQVTVTDVEALIQAVTDLGDEDPRKALLYSHLKGPDFVRAFSLLAPAWVKPMPGTEVEFKACEWSGTPEAPAPPSRA